jgi:hypothetical protein
VLTSNEDRFPSLGMKGNIGSSDQHHIKTLFLGHKKLRCIPTVKNRLGNPALGLGQRNLVKINPRKLRTLA